MTESDRLARNAQRWAECHLWLVTQGMRLVAYLEADGFRPRIQCGWRSPTDQLREYMEGSSSVKWGFHCATTPEGKPDALAVDLLDDDHPLASSRAYVLHLSAHANRLELMTGILWGLTTAETRAVTAAVLVGDWAFSGRIGWDPTHVQPAHLTIAQAKKGMRP